MKSKIALLALVSGLSLLFYTFYVKQLNESKLMSVYLAAQEQNLEAGWNKQWQQRVVDYLNQTQEVVPGYHLTVDRRGKLIGSAFFPAHSESSADWSRFEQLNNVDQKSFLLKQLMKQGSWDRAIAVRKWWQLYQQAPDGLLSPYEQTLIWPEAKTAFDLLFKQLAQRSDYTGVGKQFVLDEVLLKANEIGEVTLFIPKGEYLTTHLLPEFNALNHLGNSKLKQNPLFLQLDETALFDFDSDFRLLYSIAGIFLCLLALTLYLLELTRQKQQVDKKITFLNQLVHEIKTPLTGMKLNLELLQKYGHDEELLRALIQSSDRLHNLFSDIVLINNPNSEANPILLSAKSFEGFIRQLVDEFDGAITLDFQCRQSVYLETQRLAVVLRNLYKNAVRYGQRGHCSVIFRQGKLQISVTDEGPGVAKSDATHIFSEFFRASSAKQSSPDGLGIGLTIVKKLVTQIGGDIMLANPGKPNATFILTLEIPNE
ncbi:HAMP domain-containing histidine kinase [Shewanella sp. C32]|uniref:histidine kinase n=1 Tax=Shewanella electrica TaxID=515560 RepID=A0ABT2FL63_9GAMM|nr:HAMP domain-containing sensor histidine kinase [Shewanella electrica]MCH1923860.1 HAMP domain-containing histidine kinase [Shewanella electrica]MCS4557079.1 HAMP domain-containing histidine kinase [Shewanella electrica]